VPLVKAKKASIFPPIKSLMKSSTQVFTSLVSALAIICQSAIATYVCAAPQVTINSGVISIGTKTRTNFLNCSKSNPCRKDGIVIDSYKEKFNSNGKLQGADIVIYNTSFAPVAIEVYGSDGTLLNVDFVDGATAGFKDLGEFNKAAISGLIEIFQCTTDLFKCLSDPRYGIERNERTINLQSGDLIRISRGSDAAHAYTLASSLIDLIELMKSIPGVSTSKVKFPTLFQGYSKELRRKIVRKFIIDKIKEKYTWEMLIKELGSESFKRTASNSQDLFDNSLEIVKNIPQDFWKNLEDGTIPSTVAGDFVDTLIPMVSAKASIYLSSALFGSQSVGIRARYMASKTAHKNPSYIIIAGLEDSSISASQTMVAASSTIEMEYEKAYHCHERGSEKIKNGLSNFRCDLMSKDSIDDPYSYVSIDKIMNLSCSGNITGTIEYDEGKIYKYLMTCSKPIAVAPSQCSNVLEQSKSKLTNVTKFQITYKGIVPEGKIQDLMIMSSGVKKSTSLAMSTTIITSCPKIGIVRFVNNVTYDVRLYALSNGNVQLFECKQIEGQYKWRQYICS
jgi:hypothetical protein